jgi:acetoin utilization deacetylase AcuC-like enzyme
MADRTRAPHTPARAARLAAAVATELAAYARRAAVLARRRARRAALYVRPPAAFVVHHPGYRSPPTAAVDPRRGERVLAHLVDEGWLASTQIVAPDELPLEALARVHGIEHLERLDDPAAVARALGEVELPRAAAAGLVVAQRWATAGTVRAVEIALGGRRSELGGVAASLGGGFHHAGPRGASGFCLFNDVAVAIAQARAAGFEGRVLVLDLDLHHGDGTRAFFAEDDDVFTCSIHAASLDDRPARASLDLALGRAVGDETYLRALGDVLPEAFARARPDLVVYVSGVDVAADDRLGGWRLSPDAIFERDRRVLERASGLPVAMVLAGGYGPDAWRYTARTLAWLLGGVDEPIPSGAERDLDRFRRIASTIARAELASGGRGRARAPVEDDFGITAEDVYGELVQKRPSAGLLGLYTVYGLEVAFERYGLLAHLRKRGYARVRLELDTDAPSGQSITVRTADLRGDVLIELVVQEMRAVPPLRLLSIEWLMMQDPRGAPSPDRPLLPSQHHPGLGALPLMMGMLVMAAERLSMDGITFLPAHFHVAAQARGFLEFLEPADEALFAAFCGVLGGLPLATSAELLAAGRVVDGATGLPLAWRPARMVLPVSDALRARTRGPDYDRAVEAAAKRLDVRLTPVAEAGEAMASGPPAPPVRPPAR